MICSAVWKRIGYNPSIGASIPNHFVSLKGNPKLAMKTTLLLLALLLTACNLETTTVTLPTPTRLDALPPGGSAQVLQVIDGDTIDVEINGVEYRVRYVGVNTPERDEPCYREARDANAGFVEGRTVHLVKDVSETDRFDRLLRYVYVDGVHVNYELIALGYAEVVRYTPDVANYNLFRQLEQSATQANRGCHPTGIFNDGDDER